ncbi:NACHT and WD domain protein [Decorospora gaudefroyi]|uniref:NACHT and WD domain protein n=1 Tax=Decorospora gaudefroyi TaxID=184978 RepID=A0A6A5KK31_9PLEO|nr:NACHT and WD domain protein [Decorospora gaudefroyi]
MFSKAFTFRRDSDRKGRRRESDDIDPIQSPTRIDDSHSTREPSVSQSITPSSQIARSESENESGALGLTVVYTPVNDHKADIVFIHGLGGSSRMTWSKDRNPELFWPLTFLPLEPDICLARILSFGYNADFVHAGNVSNVILDFAKTLLYDLKYSTDNRSDSLNMGKVPLLFVVHSMGGLIVKEAYMQGQNDPEYEDIVKAISAIVFLATPHRGTNLAKILNRILQSTPLTNSKQFISELTRNSSTLQKLNEQFRHIAPKLQIVSFYETQPTSIGFKNARVMVVEKDSSLLGYPGEISKAMDADHHGVCKYQGPKDPNYVTVKNILKFLLRKTISANQSSRPGIPDRRLSRDLKSILAISEFPDIDYIFFQDQWTQGTNDWVFEQPAYIEWLRTRGTPQHVLWLKGGAATGKSVLCSFIINRLVEQGLCCQYFFIRFGDQKKRTLGLLLRSIAYQIAQQLPDYLQKVLDLEDEAMDFEAANPRTIWNRVFRSILFKLEPRRPLYWVIDGLDEADDRKAMMRLLLDLPMSSIPIRVLVASRETVEIATGLENIPSSVDQGVIGVEGHLEDLRCYIGRELTLPGTTDFKESIVQRILEGAQNNFLWVRLAVEKLNSCHTHSAVERALHECPSGMEAIYDRMALAITQHHSSSDRSLASAVLRCVTCSFRVLTTAEVVQALDSDIPELLDREESIKSVCSGFVVIDNGGNVAIVHQTAREYLLGDVYRPFHVNRNLAHEQLFLSCMRCLMSSYLRSKTTQEIPEFVRYSSTWWSSHLVSLPPESELVAKVVKKFLAGHWILIWIQILAIEGRLRILIQTSKHLSTYATRRKRLVAGSSESKEMMDQELIESWAVDLVKIVGKFGHILRRNPASIYKLIPPFCPLSSAIYQQFGRAEQKTLMVSGISTQTWDDSLARLSFRFGIYASSISATGAYIAVLASSGKVSLYDSSVFEEASASPITHGERVYRMKMSSSGTLLVTYGFKTTKIWETATGKCTVAVQNVESRPRPLVILFTNDNNTLLVGSDDKKLRSLKLNEPSPSWEVVATFEEEELEGHFLNAASYMTLSNDGSLMAVAYRGHPLSAWEVDGPFHLGHCWRAREEVARGEVVEAMWHPHGPEILGLYIEGVVFKWNPYSGSPEEIRTGASRLAMSGDGNLFATGDVRGTIKVYNTNDFRLLYQLASQDSVLGLAFSADQHRLYDVRGYYGNTWEPAALVRYAERSVNSTDVESEVEDLSQYSNTTVHTSQRIDAVSVLAASPKAGLYCYGTEGGRLRLFDMKAGALSDLRISKSFLSVEQLAWSDDGEYLAYADSGKKIFILRISTSASGSDTVTEGYGEISLKNDTEGPIDQLFFHPDSSHIFVSTVSTICVISLQSASVVHTMALHLHGCKWITHPQNSALLLGFRPESVQSRCWELNEKSTYRIEVDPDPRSQSKDDNASILSTLDQILVSPDKKQILVQMSAGRNSKELHVLFFATSCLSVNTITTSESEPASSQPTIAARRLPRQITSQIGRALVLRKGGRLLFLSRNFSICSWDISSILELTSYLRATNRVNHANNATISLSNSSTPQRQERRDTGVSNAQGNGISEIFAMPADWISRDCLEMCTVWLVEKSLLCPRNGEIAVVRCTSFS